MTGFKVSRTVSDGITTVSIAGEFDVYTAGDARDVLRPAAAAGPVVVDLTACTFLDFTGLGTVVGALKEARNAGHDLAVACSSDPILKIFRTTGMTRVLKVKETVQEAAGEVRGDG